MGSSVKNGRRYLGMLLLLTNRDVRLESDVFLIISMSSRAPRRWLLRHLQRQYSNAWVGRVASRTRC